MPITSSITSSFNLYLTPRLWITREICGQVHSIVPPLGGRDKGRFALLPQRNSCARQGGQDRQPKDRHFVSGQGFARDTRSPPTACLSGKRGRFEPFTRKQGENPPRLLEKRFTLVLARLAGRPGSKSVSQTRVARGSGGFPPSCSQNDVL